MNTVECKNCKSETSGNYCSNCGQTTKTHRIDLRHIIHEFSHGILHVDKGILFTAKELTLRPGRTIRNYLSGKRICYFKPFGYFFLLATIYVFCTHVNNPFDVSDEYAKFNVSIDAGFELGGGDPADLQKKQVVENAGVRLQEFFKLMNKHMVSLWLLAIPFFSLSTMLIFRKMKYNYGEHLIINSYIGGHFMLLNIICIPVGLIVSEGVINCLQIGLLLYMLIAIFNQYGFVRRIAYSSLAMIITATIASIIFVAIILSLIFLQP